MKIEKIDKNFSFTQGGCASRPDQSYQALIAKRNNVDYINLGFSGNAKGEDLMVDYLASIDCGLFACDYDHNAPTAEYLKIPIIACMSVIVKSVPIPLFYLSQDLILRAMRKGKNG